MRIIDSNKDFYDFYQGIYRDDTTTFDRRDSYDLSKKEFASHFYMRERYNKYYYNEEEERTNYVLLQVCNSFWLFKLYITETDNYDKCVDYTLELLDKWKDYNAKEELIKLSHVSFYTSFHNMPANKQSIIDKNYKEIRVFNKFAVYTSCKPGKSAAFGDFAVSERYIPILKNIGLAGLVDPLEIYLAFDEYLSKQITKNERAESVGITDKEKVINHGFDAKTSFRGKRCDKKGN